MRSSGAPSCQRARASGRVSVSSTMASTIHGGV
jgi:hypothetical protein